MRGGLCRGISPPSLRPSHARTSLRAVRSTVVAPSHVGAVIARGLLRALAAAIPGASPWSPRFSRARTTPATISSRAGACVIPCAADHGRRALRCEVVCHEHQHAAYIEAEPDAAVIVDYPGRASSRDPWSEAYAVGMWVRYLLTGEIPTLDSALASPGRARRALDAGDVATARARWSRTSTRCAPAWSLRCGCAAPCWRSSAASPDAIVPPEHGAPS